MAHRVALIGSVLAVRWERAFEMADFLALRREVEEARVTAGAPLIMVSICPSDLNAMSGETRQGFSRLIDKIKHNFREVHIVLEGKGFFKSLYRSLVTAVVTVTDTSNMVTVHESVTVAFGHCAATLAVEPAQLIAAARMHDLVA
jgi:hypothetical protein